MSLYFCDGFDYYATGNIGEKWTVVGSGTIVGGGRNGNCMRLGDSSVPIQLTVPSGGSYVIGAAIKMPTFAGSARLFDLFDSVGTQICALFVNGDGTLNVLRGSGFITGGTSTYSLVINTWYYVEWKFTVSTSIASNSCLVNVNGVNWINVPAGSNIQGSTPVSKLYLGGVAGYTAGLLYDDLYVLIQDATAPNDFLGDSKIQALVPAADGNYVAWSFTGGATRWQSCNSTPENTALYISSATPGNLYTATYGSLASTPASIAGVQLNLVAEMDDAGPHSLAAIVRQSGVDYVQGTLPNLVNGTYAHQRTVMNTNPATGAAWTAADINTLEAGVKQVT